MYTFREIVVRGKADQAQLIQLRRECLKHNLFF